MIDEIICKNCKAQVTVEYEPENAYDAGNYYVVSCSDGCDGSAYGRDRDEALKRFSGEDLIFSDLERYEERI